MKRVLTLAILFAAIALVPVAAQDNPELDAAITRYMEVTKVGELIVASLEQMALQAPKAQQAIFREVMNKVISVDEIIEHSKKSLRKHFTLEEINALTDFYSSPVGVSAMSKLPLVMGDTMPYIQSLTGKIREEIQRMYQANPALFEPAPDQGEATESSKE